jgi:opacity protein-like surface antigen
MLFRLLLVVVLLSLSQLSFAQSPVNLSGSIGGGLVLPQSSNLMGNIYSNYDYPLSKASYDFNGKVRLGLPVLPFSIVGSISYNSLSDNAVIPVTTSSGVVNSKYTSSLSIVGVGLGIEYSFLPIPIIKPYIGANVVMNFISGSATYDNSIIPTSNLNSTSRLGLDLGIGTIIDVPMLPISFDLEAKYRFANISGKDFGGSGGLNGFGGIPQTSTYNLNDAKNPNDANDHDRSINYFTITLGINFKIF